MFSNELTPKNESDNSMKTCFNCGGKLCEHGACLVCEYEFMPASRTICACFGIPSIELQHPVRMVCQNTIGTPKRNAYPNGRTMSVGEAFALQVECERVIELGREFNRRLAEHQQAQVDSMARVSCEELPFLMPELIEPQDLQD